MEPYYIQQFVSNALQEDLSWGDVTSDNLFEAQWQTSLILRLKQEGVVAGLAVAEQVFRTLDPQVRWQSQTTDGIYFRADPRTLAYPAVKAD